MGTVKKLLKGDALRSRRIVGVAIAAAVAASGVVALQGLGGSGSGGDSAAAGKARPVETALRTVALKAGSDGGVELKRQDTRPFSLLGVSWADPTAKVAGTIQARTRGAKNGAWSQWITLKSEGDTRQERRGKGLRGATEPTWVGPSNGVEVRVVAGRKASSALPAGLRLDLVDPGTSQVNAAPAAYAFDATPTATADPTVSTGPGTPTGTADTGSPSPAPSGSGTPSADPSTSPPATPSDSTSPPGSPSASASPSATAPSAPASTVPEPPIVSRADWGADESISPEAPEYNADVKAVFVHHTAETNDYTCADSAAIVRGIYTYHVKTNGWKDIGYNFLVDKCGTIFEGRKGGVDLPVLGAHTYGFNRESTGVAVLGTYTDTAAPAAVLTSVARLAAWKLGQYGGDPAGTVQLTAGATQTNYAGTAFTAGSTYTFKRISGHRDGYNTECPGNALYAQLPTISSYAAGPVTGLAIKSMTGAALSGSTYYTKAAVTVGWTATTPSSLISRFELLVDGKVVATTAGTATSAKATLAVGSHKVAVRAVHQSGKTTTTTAATVVAETTAPTFTTKPALALRAGTVNTTAVPVRLSWKATDNAALKSVALTAPTAATYGPTVTGADLTAKSGTATTWAMKATDYAGNTGTASVIATPVILQETSAVKSGTWTTRSSTSYLGGKSYSSSAKNASLTWTFTGRSAAWAVSRASTSGQAYVYVDGTKVATVDLKSTTTKYRQAIWTKSWSSSAKHTVKIVVVGTSGRPTVTTDGLLYLK
jgi:uncharacterized protein with LGFP repeats